MASKELIDYVEQGLKRGQDVAGIKRKLARAGHQISDIEEAARHVLLTKPHLRHVRYKIFAGIFVLATILIMAVLIFTFEEKEKFVQYKENITYSAMTDRQLLDLARQEDSFAPCMYVRDHNARYACLDKLWKRNDCYYDILLEEGASCFTNLALKSLNDSFCVSIGNSVARASCFEQVYSAVKERGDISLCHGSTACIRRMIRDSGRSEENCELFADSKERDMCLLNLTLASQKPESCKKINDQSMRKECYFTFSGSFDFVAPFCDEFYSQYLEEGQVLADAQAARAKHVCFFQASVDLITKGFYTCSEMLDYADRSVGSWAYLSGFREFYAEMAQVHFEDLAKYNNPKMPAEYNQKIYGCAR